VGRERPGEACQLLEPLRVSQREVGVAEEAGSIDVGIAAVFLAGDRVSTLLPNEGTGDSMGRSIVSTQLTLEA